MLEYYRRHTVHHMGRGSERASVMLREFRRARDDEGAKDKVHKDGWREGNWGIDGGLVEFHSQNKFQISTKLLIHTRPATANTTGTYVDLAGIILHGFVPVMCSSRVRHAGE